VIIGQRRISLVRAKCWLSHKPRLAATKLSTCLYTGVDRMIVSEPRPTSAMARDLHAGDNPFEVA